MNKKTTCNVKRESRKVFVGGIDFSDMEAQPDVVRLKQKRIQKLYSLFRRLGRIDNIQPHWNEGYCHVIYKTQKIALRVCDKLCDYQARKKFMKQIKLELVKEGENPKAVPMPTFYIRRPRTLLEQPESTL